MDDEQHRERSCTRKRPFATREYAEMFLANELCDDTMEAYCCRFCREWHLGHPNPLRLPGVNDAERYGQTNQTGD